MLQAGSLGSVEATNIFLLRHENKIMWVQVCCTLHALAFSFRSTALSAASFLRRFDAN
jgi:hypothetical protein